MVDSITFVMTIIHTDRDYIYLSLHQLCGVTFLYRISFLRSLPTDQILIADYIHTWLRSKECDNIRSYKDRVRFGKELIDVAALRRYMLLKMRFVLS